MEGLILAIKNNQTVSQKNSYALVSNIFKGENVMKNIRKRADGRWEWRKQINNVPYQKIDKDYKKLVASVRNFLKPLKQIELKKSMSFIDIAWEWYNLYKKDIKSSSRYESVLRLHFDLPLFKKDIGVITYIELERYLGSITEHRTADYCYLVIKGVYTEAYRRDLVKKNLGDLINKPKNRSVKGTQFSYAQQKLILDNLDKTPIAKEIIFYLLTGCRRNEVYDIQIDYDTLQIFINGTKREGAKRYVPISQTYANYLKENIHTMFKRTPRDYNERFKKFMDELGLTGKTIHTLRHTYSTNLYYLGVPDKQRQAFLGHSSIVITNDIYTHLEPNLKKEDILNLYKDLYPKF